MGRVRVYIFLLFLPVAAYSAKYAGEAFSLGVGGRPLAMGGAAIAGPFDASSGYWNPAGLNYLEGRNVIAMHAETFGSLLNHDFVAYASRSKDTTDKIQSYGFYFYYLGGGGIKITDYDPEINRPYVVREESHGDLLLAGSLSGRVQDRFDAGLTVRVIYRDLGPISGFGLTADAGALYFPEPYLVMGLMVTDLFSGFIRYSEGITESILPTVKPAVTIKHAIGDFTGYMAFSGDIKFEGIRAAAQYWVGDISLDTHLGCEIGYRGLVFGRAGFDIGSFTGGIGLNANRITVDVAYLHSSYLDGTFRVSAGYRF
jgi:hypothetical protein